MDLDETMHFTLVNDQGEEVQCEVLFTFEDKQTGRNYLIYTDYSRDDEGNFKVFASVYEPGGESQRLQPVQTDEEWRMIEEILSNLQQEVLASESEEDEGLF